MSISTADILELSVEERIRLVGDIWDSIAEIPENIPLSPETRRLIEQRLDEFHKNPGSGSPWQEVKIRLLAGR